MIFGLVTFAKVKLHPSPSTIRSAIHQAMKRLIFAHEVDRLEDGNLGKLGLWGANQLVL